MEGSKDSANFLFYSPVANLDWMLQRGDGGYLPHRLLGKGISEGKMSNGLQVETFQYAPNLEGYMRQAELIISHAGAGSLFEAMRMGKPLIAVPNPILMHNHQAELVSDLLL